MFLFTEGRNLSNRGHSNVYGARPEREKRYVDVVSLTSADGLVTPLEIRWADGRRFRIDKVTDRRQAQSFKTGGTGMRYAIHVGGQTTHLFYDDHKKAWFVEAKTVTDTPNW